MKNLLRWAGAVALVLVASPCAAQSLIPNCRNTGGSYIPCYPVVIVDKNGIIVDASNPLPMKQPGATSTSTAGSITAANSYQSVVAANSNRRGCVIQNKSTDVLRVFLGAPGAATDAASFNLPAGETFSCTTSGGLVVFDQISVSGPTVGDAFLLVLQ